MEGPLTPSFLHYLIFPLPHPPQLRARKESTKHLLPALLQLQKLESHKKQQEILQFTGSTVLETQRAKGLHGAVPKKPCTQLWERLYPGTEASPPSRRAKSHKFLPKLISVAWTATAMLDITHTANSSCFQQLFAPEIGKYKTVSSFLLPVVHRACLLPFH